MKRMIPAIMWSLAVVALLFAGASAKADVPYGKVVAEIVTQGNRVRSQADILSQMKTRPGTDFNLVTAQDDVNRLYSKGWFRDVGIRTTI